MAKPDSSTSRGPSPILWIEWNSFKERTPPMRRFEKRHARMFRHLSISNRPCISSAMCLCSEFWENGKTNMRILYCNKYNFEFSGTEVYLLDLMRLVRQEGHETALFSMADSRGKPSPYDKYAVPPIDFKRPAGPLQQLRSAAHAIYSRGARRRIRSLLHDFQPQLAHVRNIYHHLSPSILWELRQQCVPVIYHLNDFKMLCPSYNLVSGGESCERCVKGAFRHVISEGCYAGGRAASVWLAAAAYVHKWWKTYSACVDLLLAPTNFVRDKMVENGWNSQAVEVLPHFQRVPQEAAPAPVTDAPILYFGRLSVEKGVIDLLRVMRSIPKIRLIVAGDWPQR